MDGPESWTGYRCEQTERGIFEAEAAGVSRSNELEMASLMIQRSLIPVPGVVVYIHTVGDTIWGSV